jgi:hypothetical protein
MRLLGAHVVGEQATEVVHYRTDGTPHGIRGRFVQSHLLQLSELGDPYKYATYNAILNRLLRDGRGEAE